MAEKVRIDLEDPTGNFWGEDGIVVLQELMREKEV